MNAKKELYNYIAKIRRVLNIKEYPIDIRSIADNIDDLHIVHQHFNSKGLYGMLVPAECGDEQYIMLVNDKQEFDTETTTYAHEIIHFFRHRDKYAAHMFYYDGGVMPIEDVFCNWEAVEGGDELLVPYKLFIPECVRVDSKLPLPDADEYLGKRFRVGAPLIKRRRRSLQYEIDQYLNGVSIEEVDLGSNTQLIGPS